MNRFVSVALILISAVCNSHPDIDKRIDIINELIISQPNNGKLYLQRADLHIQHGNLNAANQDVRLAKINQARKAEVDYYYGRICRKKGETQKAIEFYKKSVNQFLQSGMTEPLQILAYTHLAEIYRNQMSWSLAAQNYKNAINHSKKPTPVLYRLCADSYISANDSESAKNILLKGLRIYPNSISLYELLIGTEVDSGHIKNAISLTESLLSEYPALNTRLKYSLSELEQLKHRNPDK